jgi:hypothetical protein
MILIIIVGQDLDGRTELVDDNLVEVRVIEKTGDECGTEYRKSRNGAVPGTLDAKYLKLRVVTLCGGDLPDTMDVVLKGMLGLPEENAALHGRRGIDVLYSLDTIPCESRNSIVEWFELLASDRQKGHIALCKLQGFIL